MKFLKINDLSQSPLKRRYDKSEFVSASNYAYMMGRVSIKRNKEKGASDVAQLEHGSEYADEKNLQILRVWDVAETASNHDKRRNFLEMIDAVEASHKTNKPVTHVIFAYTSRGSRNRKSKRMLEELLDLGVTIHFTQDHLVLNPASEMSDWLTWEVKSIKDQDDVEKLRKHVWDGTVKRLEKGLFPGKAPFGYRNFRPAENAESVFVFADGPDKYMLAAFEKFATGMYSEMQLHRELELLFPHVLKRPIAKRFSYLLRNPFYYGDFLYLGQLYRGNPETHPPLISYALWKRVQDILSGRYRRKVSQKELAYIGMIKCSGYLLDDMGQETDQLWGCAVTGEEKRKKLADGSTKLYYYYHCSNTTGTCSQKDTGYMKDIVNRRPNYTETEIEMLFEAVFEPLNFTPEVCEWMQNILLQEHHEKSSGHKEQVAALHRRYQMLQSYVDRAYEDKLSGNISEEMWREKNDKWRMELETVKSEIDSLDDDKQEYIDNGVLLIELARNTQNVYQNGSQEVKRKLLEIVSSNHVLRNGKVDFSYRKPFDMLAAAHPKDKWWAQLGSNQQPPD